MLRRGNLPGEQRTQFCHCELKRGNIADRRIPLTLVIPRERSDRGNPAVRRTHQASTRAELGFEFLPLSY